MSVELTAIDKPIGLFNKLRALPTITPGMHSRIFNKYATLACDLMRVIHIEYVRTFHGARGAR
jgi:hypothetical protein